MEALPPMLRNHRHMVSVVDRYRQTFDELVNWIGAWRRYGA